MSSTATNKTNETLARLAASPLAGLALAVARMLLTGLAS